MDIKIELLKQLYTARFNQALKRWEKQVKEEDIVVKSSYLEIGFNNGSTRNEKWKFPIIPNSKDNGDELFEKVETLSEDMLDLLETLSQKVT
ncbi:hypothetical protein CAY60_018665 [Shouchella clausii]|uniref:Uncharacterized protein n=2 Tax=Shouchella TaxID=2893057 RepID=Q5WLM5_SHOC1|nr:MULTISPECIES: hypothetical protein [Shouchella]MCM3314753.1 hypothetical protein [Psychrobacillus sp. MER TA 17]ALA52693.1 hypothetical protein DB29_01865 [Shouchella clausii]KKI85950.1 hypothetical protein WZ76_12745 [Shouchella clausii]MBU3233167.1 hypothetical protein [Shouchella clausii]MBU3266140.1 hypothetical protein [Shouchella clausii]